MRYLTGVTGPDVDPHRFHPRLGLLAQPDSYGPATVRTWPVWGADNGCFALVLQDGMTLDLPWSDFDALFIGGSTAFKLGPMVQRIVLEATRRGVPPHMGRVNSHRRIALAAAMGCSSADGTFLRTAVSVNVPKMLHWFTKLDQGVQGVLPPTVPRS